MADERVNPQDLSAQLYGEEDNAIDLRRFLSPLRREWRLWLGATLAAGVIGAAGSYLITPEFTSTTTFLPPQQQQSTAASALASFGSLAGLAGLSAGKNPAEEYISLMQSVTVSDRLIDRFKLMSVYHAKYRRDARKGLLAHVRITLGKKDGLISIAVDDEDPKRAADMANQYVEELRRMTSILAVSEAQQRRAFFEKQMQESKAKLIVAQQALQDSGFSAAAIKTEPRAAADEYARLRAEATAAEVRLQTLRSSLAETAPQVRQQATTLDALRSQLALLETAALPDPSAPDYVSKYREFKYEETLFELMSKQYEIARVDESREGALIQVVDPAQVAELKSTPRRSLMAIVFALVGALLAATAIIVKDHRRAARPA